MGLFSLLTGCGESRPDIDDVNSAIAEAPGVTASELSAGPGGGLGAGLMGTIEFDVPAEDLTEALDEAWRRGIEVVHRMDEGARGRLVQGVSGVAADGTEIFVADLVDLGESKALTVGHFYDHYGIG